MNTLHFFFQAFRAIPEKPLTLRVLCYDLIAFGFSCPYHTDCISYSLISMACRLFLYSVYV